MFVNSTPGKMKQSWMMVGCTVGSNTNREALGNIMFNLICIDMFCREVFIYEKKAISES